MTVPMVGKTYRFDLGWLRVRFTVSSSSQGRFVMEEGGGLAPNGHAETVALEGDPRQSRHEATVRDNPDETRFDVFVEDTHAGFSVYKDLDETQRIFYHTVVFDEFGGRGLAGTLTRAALSTSVQAGHRIVAVCPYVKKWLTTHHDFDDATDPVGREHLRALR